LTLTITVSTELKT